MVYTIGLKTSRRCEFIDITEQIEKIVKKIGISGGICHAFIPHTTAGITVNENADHAVRDDILRALDKLVPLAAGYAHSEGNSDAHIKSSLVGNEKTLVIEGGRLKLGTWQGIFFCEFDGPRNRNVWITIEESKNAGKKI
jgi:secondary thiamine-phosphate synthase enzyme